jgi:hypothetical protein
MTLLSQIARQLLLPTQDYMDLLDYWTQFSIENHFRQLVKECKEIDNTGTTQTASPASSAETAETGEIDRQSPLD